MAWLVIIGRNSHKYNFCHDKHVFITTEQFFVVTKVWLLQQNCCHNKIMFVVTNVRCSKSFVGEKKCLLRQNNFCSDNYLWQWFAALTQFTVLIKNNAHLHADTLKKSTEEFHISVTFLIFFNMNTCRASHFQMSTKCFTTATTALFHCFWTDPLHSSRIAQWLQHRTRDWKVAGSNPCWSSRRIFFSRVDFLCWLLFRYPFHPVSPQ